MAQWTYDDFETVAYTNQHNIIQLIHFAVDTSSQVTSMQNQMNQMATQIADLANTQQQMFQLQTQMLDMLTDVTTNVSQLASIVTSQNQRIQDLENAVFGGP